MLRTEKMILAGELQRDEGVKLRPYKCPAGFWTVGAGWNIEARGLPAGSAILVRGGQRVEIAGGWTASEAVSQCTKGFTITQDTCEFLLSISIDDAIADARALFPDFDNFCPRRQRALANWTFNLGRDRAAGFRKAIAAANRYDWAECGRQLLDSKWARQVGARADRIADMVING